MPHNNICFVTTSHHNRFDSISTAIYIIMHCSLQKVQVFYFRFDSFGRASRHSLSHVAISSVAGLIIALNVRCFLEC